MISLRYVILQNICSKVLLKNTIFCKIIQKNIFLLSNIKKIPQPNINIKKIKQTPNANYSLFQKLNINSKKPLKIQQLTKIHQFLQFVDKKQVCQDQLFKKIVIKSIKQLNNSIVPSDLTMIIQLLSTINPNHKIQRSILQQYLKYLTENQILKAEQERFIQLPQEFLKEIGFKILEKLIKNNAGSTQRFCKWFRILSNFLNNKQIKQIDRYLVECLNKNSLNSQNIAMLIGQFNKLAKHGEFINLAECYIINNCSSLDTGQVIKSSVNLLELGYNKHFLSVQKVFLQRMLKNKLSNSEVNTIIHIMHAYKMGSLDIWSYLNETIKEENNFISQNNTFAILCGLFRNYRYEPNLAKKFIYLDKKFKYVDNFTPQQFVQFFLVLYPNIKDIQDQLIRNQIKAHCLQPIINYKSTKEKYKQIKYFYAYLYAQNRKNSIHYLKKANLQQMQSVLLSLCFNQIGSVSPKEAQQYEKQLISRVSNQLYQQHKERIVIEEFIRVKLIGNDIPIDIQN